MPCMTDFVKANLGLCFSAFVLFLTASKLYAFSGYNLDTAVTVLREAGGFDVGLGVLVGLLPSIFGLALLYGTIFLARRRALVRQHRIQVLAGFVVGYCLLAVSWPLATFYAVVAVICAPTLHDKATDGDARLDAAAGAFNSFFQRWVAMPIIGVGAAAALLSSTHILPTERVTTSSGDVVAAVVLSAENDELVVMRLSDSEVVRLANTSKRSPCSDGDLSFLEQPPLLQLRQSHAEYPDCRS